MALTRDEVIQSSPRSSKDPSSYEYARQMVYRLKTVWTRVRFDLKDWHKDVGEAAKNAIWSKLGYESLEELLVKEVGYSKLELDQKIDAAKASPLGEHGTNQHDIEEQIENAKVSPLGEHGGHDNVRSTGYGNDTDYTLRRLARDQPELLDEIKSGALSVNAAAIKAGIRKKLSHAEKCVAAFRKAENRLEVLSIQLGELEECELIVLKEMVEDQLANK